MVNPTHLLENDNRLHTATHTDFVGLLCLPTKTYSKEYPPGGGVNVSMIMSNYIHTWFIWLAGQ